VSEHDTLKEIAEGLPKMESADLFYGKIQHLSEEEVVTAFYSIVPSLNGVQRFALLKIALKKLNKHKNLAKLIQLCLDENLSGELGNWMALITKKIPVDKLEGMLIFNSEQGAETFTYHARSLKKRA